MLSIVMMAGGVARAQSEATLEGMRTYNNGDFATAYRLLRRAAEAGDPQAQVNLGYLYARGHGVTTDQMAALRLYELSAKAGSSEGMNAVGYKFLHATGVPKDLERAEFWFCQAIVRGNPRAMNNLAIMLVAGERPFDEPEARKLWQQAAELGHANAMFNLGSSYLNGNDPDPQKGREWVARAAHAGHAGAQRILRAQGYTGTLPPAVNFDFVMKPEPKHTLGHTKRCAGTTATLPLEPIPTDAERRQLGSAALVGKLQTSPYPEAAH